MRFSILAFGNSKIYAATSNGLWQADLSNQGLAYFGNWDQITSLPEPDSKCTHVIFSGETLYCNISQGSAGDIVYAINGGTRLFSFYSGVINSSFDIAPQGFTISSAGSLKYYKPDGSLLKDNFILRMGHSGYIAGDNYSELIYGSQIKITDWSKVKI